jgi:hypothetical protein
MVTQVKRSTSLLQSIVLARGFSTKQVRTIAKMAGSRRPPPMTSPIKEKSYGEDAFEFNVEATQVPVATPVKPVEVKVPEPGQSILANDSTLLLMKKFMVYKLMGSNLFINYSLGAMKVCYRAFGIKLTNFAINNSVASIFTSGETIKSLTWDV